MNEKPFVEYWNNNYTKNFDNKIIYDNWLEKYNDLISNCKTKILDLGCGAGNDTLYLLSKNKSVISCDYSEVALKKLKTNIHNAETMMVDISSTPLPFNDNSFDLIIADLSLHYFSEQKTIEIMKDLKRILNVNGSLIARVNSVKDTNFGAGLGTEIEKNYYYVNGYNKRFFTEKDVTEFFSYIGQVSFNETTMNRYGNTKYMFEILARKYDI